MQKILLVQNSSCNYKIGMFVNHLVNTFYQSTPNMGTVGLREERAGLGRMVQRGLENFNLFCEEGIRENRNFERFTCFKKKLNSMG